MLTEQTVDKLNALKLGAMADAFQKQLNTDEAAVLSFEERLGLLVLPAESLGESLARISHSHPARV